jgi:hypothetical protein
MVATEQADFKSSIPINYEPVVQQTGISAGYLRAAPGITLATATGTWRRPWAIVWNGVHYRVIGPKLGRLDGSTFTVLGDVGDNGLPVSLDFSVRLGLPSPPTETCFIGMGPRSAR